MSIIEKKEKNLIQLIEKLDSLSLSYSQPNCEIEKIRSEKNELSRQKNEIGKKIQTGKFGATMDVSLINEGPVTIFMDSKNKY